MGSLDAVWAQLKEKAAYYALCGATPGEAEAKQVVGALLHAAHLDPRPGRDVVDFYAREFISLIEELREAKPA